VTYVSPAVRQDYETLLHPTGLLLKIVLHCTSCSLKIEALLTDRAAGRSFLSCRQAQRLQKCARVCLRSHGSYVSMVLCALTGSWGDAYYMGLDGLQVLGEQGQALHISPEQVKPHATSPVYSSLQSCPMCFLREPMHLGPFPACPYASPSLTVARPIPALLLALCCRCVLGRRRCRPLGRSRTAVCLPTW
jgi:hypothetical protein